MEEEGSHWLFSDANTKALLVFVFGVLLIFVFGRNSSFQQNIGSVVGLMLGMISTGWIVINTIMHGSSHLKPRAVAISIGKLMSDHHLRKAYWLGATLFLLVITFSIQQDSLALFMSGSLLTGMGLDLYMYNHVTG